MTEQGDMLKLTVIFRNDAPMMFAGDSPTYRSVQIELTPEQKEKIKLRFVGRSEGRDMYEDYSRCFLEKE